MSFGVQSIVNFIFSLSIKLKNLFIAFIPAISFPSNNYLLSRKYSAKAFKCLLCLLVLMFSANHVVCIEFSKGKIAKAHLQIFECGYPQSSDPVEYNLSSNHETSHTLLSGMTGPESSCPHCIDEHIQFSKSFSGISFSPNILTITFFPAYQNHSFQHHILASVSLFHKYKHVPSPDHRLASIHSTVLLV